MSDFSISVVPTISDYPDRKVKAAEIRAWLLAESIIAPKLSACILSKNLGYSVGMQANKVVITPLLLPFDLAVNELDIITERTIFSTELEELICPNCKNNIASDDWDLLPWFEQKSIGINCPQCAQEAPIHQ